jgi:hypothetical protein
MGRMGQNRTREAKNHPITAPENRFSIDKCTCRGLLSTITAPDNGGTGMEWPPFYRTALGERFFAQRVPALIKQLERLNTVLERLADQQEGRDEEDR